MLDSSHDALFELLDPKSFGIANHILVCPTLLPAYLAYLRWYFRTCVEPENYSAFLDHPRLASAITEHQALGMQIICLVSVLFEVFGPTHEEKLVKLLKAKPYRFIQLITNLSSISLKRYPFRTIMDTYTRLATHGCIQFDPDARQQLKDFSQADPREARKAIPRFAVRQLAKLVAQYASAS